MAKAKKEAKTYDLSWRGAEGTIEMVPLEELRPNPYQPRATPDLAKRAELKVSIRDHGLAQYPVGRRHDGTVEIGDGSERAVCFRELREEVGDKYACLPVIVRSLTDQEMADLALESNEKRQALNQLDLAAFFRRYLDEFKVTQEDLAARFGMTQSALSNIMRLLDLPEKVKEKIISQEISPTHGRVLLQIKDSPETQERLADELVEKPETVAEFSFRVAKVAKQSYRPLERYYHPHGEPKFDRKDCEGCQSRVVPGPSWANDPGTESFCSNIDCWEKKQKAALAVEKEVERKRIAKEVGRKGVVILSNLPWGSYERLSKEDMADCSKSCEHFKHGKHDKGSPTVEVVCTNPKCLRGRRSKRTKAENQRKAQSFEMNLIAIHKQLFQKVQFVEEACQPLLREMLKRLPDSRDMKMLCRELGLKSDTSYGYDKVVAKGLEEKKSLELFWLLVLVALNRGYGRIDQSHSYSIEDPEKMKLLIEAMGGTITEEVTDDTGGRESVGGNGRLLAQAALPEARGGGKHKAAKAGGQRRRPAADPGEPGKAADSHTGAGAAGEDGSQDNDYTDEGGGED